MKNKITNKLLFTTLFALCSCTGTKGEKITFDSQLDALNKLAEGTVEVAIIDSVMAGYYTSNGSLKDKVGVVPNLIFAEEEYGIAAKKGNDSLIQNINKALYTLYDNGGYQGVATQFGLSTTDYALSSNPTYTVTATDNAYSNVLTRNKVVIGYTVFAPIAYTDTASNTLTGFDIELAKKVFNTLAPSIEIEWLVIDWSTKETKLADGTIDLVWNGLTITEERQEKMAISVPYLKNNQVAVTKTNDLTKFNTVDAIKKAVIGVELGSAGEDVVNELLELN